ncbi:hypothetical protein [Pseudonocardia xishanensis]|uniref:Uncharacterized protein n=1 Tax=Pseudonocardia xishanensis TaxID=630995 RepID=A0ABP8RQL3_9PSEU
MELLDAVSRGLVTQSRSHHSGPRLGELGDSRLDLLGVAAGIEDVHRRDEDLEVRGDGGGERDFS